MTTPLPATSPSATALSTACFCTYDIRAVVNDAFGAPTYDRLAKAFALWLRDTKHLPVDQQPWVAVGWDARTHSPELAQVLINSLNAAGLQVLSLGLVPSPLVYFAEHYAKLEEATIPQPAAAIVVTASHNPSPYNGAKFTFNGLSITKDDLLAIKAIFSRLETEVVPLPVFGQDMGQVQHWDPIPAYRQWSAQQFGQFQTAPKVVVDSGNGTAGVVAPALFRQLGCQVISLFEEPDGRFPNHHPDPCAHKNLVDLQNAVLAHQADFGIAFDGDSDRLGVVDSKGRIITGDFLLMLYAQDLMSEPHAEPPIVVSEVKCSQHLFDQVNAMGAQALMAPTGHAYIKNKMKEVDALLGGELSGHVFFRDRHWGFDDAIYAALRLLQFLDKQRQKQPGLTLGDLTDQLPVSYLSEEKRIYLERDARPAVMQALSAATDPLAEYAGLPVVSLETLDGIRLNLQGGFWLVRISNTEPCFTVRAEASDPKTLQRLETTLLDQLYKLIQQQLPGWTPEQAGHGH